MRLLTSAAAIAAALILPVAAHAADAPAQVTLDASKPGAVIDRNIFGQFAERYEEIQAALLAASGLILASAASAQTAGTPILAGLRIGRFPVRDRTSPSMIPSRGRQSGRAQTTGTGGIWEVVAIHAVDGGVAKGDHVVASVWVKSNVPAKAVFRIEAGAGPRARVDDRFIDIGPISVLNKDGN